MRGIRQTIANGSPRTRRCPVPQQRPAKPVEFPPKKTQAELAYELEAEFDRAWGQQG
jgi:hypothetical protein